MRTCKTCEFVRAENRGGWWTHYACKLGAFDFELNVNDDFLHDNCTLDPNPE